MNTSRQEVIANLKSCLPIYKKLYELSGYKMTEDDSGCLKEFHELFEAGFLDDERVLAEAGISYEMFGTLVGYASIALNISKSG